MWVLSLKSSPFSTLQEEKLFLWEKAFKVIGMLVSTGEVQRGLILKPSIEASGFKYNYS